MAVKDYEVRLSLDSMNDGTKFYAVSLHDEERLVNDILLSPGECWQLQRLLEKLHETESSTS